MSVNDKTENRGTHGVSSSMLDTLVSSSENPLSLDMGSVNCRHCVYYSREKNGEYCEKWCKDLKKSFCTKGFCDKSQKCVYGEEPACEKAEKRK